MHKELKVFQLETHVDNYNRDKTVLQLGIKLEI